ncbi:MAG: LysM peptidoglycan-binding domain-containing protein [Planctomycetota bacterium]
MNSLKNTIVAILLLGVSYGVYQILTTAEPKALSTAEFHAANGPEIEIPGETFIPPPIDTDSDTSLSLTEQPKPPQFNAPPVQPPAGVTGPSNQSGQSMPERQLGTNAPSSSPPPWAQIPDNRSSPAPSLGGGNSPLSDSGSPGGSSLAIPSPTTSNGSVPMPPPFNAGLGSSSPSAPNPGFPQTGAAPFDRAPGGGSSLQPSPQQRNVTEIPAQTSTGAVGLMSGSAPLPTLESSLQTARQFVAAGQMRQALAELSSQLLNPELEMPDQTTLYKWLDSLAGKVIYSGEHHLVTQPHIVQPNETLTSLAEAWRVPPELIYNLNRERIANPFELAAGTELKKVSGPFRAELDVNRQLLTLYLDELYAGRFRCVSLSANLPAGVWKIENKVENKHPAGQFLLQTKHPEVSLHGQPADGAPVGCCFAQDDAKDLFWILSVGSEIKVIR